MAVVTTEIEVTSSLAAAKLFKTFGDIDNIITEVSPENYKVVETIQGDGGVGSIKSVTYGDVVPFTSSKHRFDVMDAEFNVSYTIFEGDALLGILESATNHLKFITSLDGGCVFKHSTVYKCEGIHEPTEEVANPVKELYAKTFKDIEGYVKANPNAY